MHGKRRAIDMIEPPRKRRKAAPAIEEITFDLDAREDYLTGFHKRKLQRAKHAREEAAKREREEKITARKLLRESRKADLEKHVAEINSMLQREADPDPVNLGEENRPNGGDNQEQSDGTMEHLNADLEAKYLDEDRYTTVTVEAVDVSRDGLHKVAHDEVDESDGEGLKESSPKVMLADRRRNPGEKRLPSKVKSVHKKKKRKFRYESKAERKTTRHKERSKNSAKARDRKS